MAQVLRVLLEFCGVPSPINAGNLEFPTVPAAAEHLTGDDHLFAGGSTVGRERRRC